MQDLADRNKSGDDSCGGGTREGGRPEICRENLPPILGGAVPNFPNFSRQAR
jgi:hypothetical protein